MIIKGIDQVALVRHVTNEYETWRSDREDMESEWKEIYRAFKSKHPTTLKIPTGRSNRFVNLPEQAAYGLHSQISGGLMPHPEFFQLIPEDPKNEKYGDSVTSELMYQIDAMGLYGSVSRAILQAVLYGFSPVVISWDERIGMKTKGFIGLTPFRRPYTIYSGPKLTVCDSFNTYWDPHAEPEDPFAARLRRVWRSKHYLEERAKKVDGYRIYENVDDVQTRADYPDASDDNLLERLFDKGLNDTEALKKVKTDRAEIIERWGNLDFVDSNGKLVHLENHVIVICNRTILLRCEPNPLETGRIPLVKMTYQEDVAPASVYPTGALGGARGIGDAANRVINQFIDLVSKMIKGQFKYKKGSRFNPDDWEMSVDELIGVGNMDDLMPILHDMRLFNIVQLFGLLKAEYQDATGQMKNFTTPQYRKTATEVSAVASAMSARIREVVKHIESDFLMEVLTIMIDLTRQYGNKKKFSRSVRTSEGQKWVEIDPKAFEKEFRIRAIGSGYIANREERLMHYNMFLQTLGQLPQELLAQINFPHIIRKIYAEFGFRDDDQVILEGGMGGQEAQAAPGPGPVGVGMQRTVGQ